GEKREDGGAVPVVGRSAGGVGGESGIALIQEIVAADAQQLAGGQGFALAYSRQPAASLVFAGETDAVDHFGQRRVTIAGLAVGDDHVIRGPTEFACQPVGGGGEGVLVVGMGGHN